MGNKNQLMSALSPETWDTLCKIKYKVDVSGKEKQKVWRG